MEARFRTPQNRGAEPVVPPFFCPIVFGADSPARPQRSGPRRGRRAPSLAWLGPPLLRSLSQLAARHSRHCSLMASYLDRSFRPATPRPSALACFSMILEPDLSISNQPSWEAIPPREPCQSCDPIFRSSVSAAAFARRLAGKLSHCSPEQWRRGKAGATDVTVGGPTSDCPRLLVAVGCCLVRDHGYEIDVTALRWAAFVLALLKIAEEPTPPVNRSNTGTIWGMKGS